MIFFLLVFIDEIKIIVYFVIWNKSLKSVYDCENTCRMSVTSGRIPGTAIWVRFEFGYKKKCRSGSGCKKSYRCGTLQQYHTSRNLEMRLFSHERWASLLREMRISQGDLASPIGDELISRRWGSISRGRWFISYGRWGCIFNFLDMWHHSPPLIRFI